MVLKENLFQVFNSSTLGKRELETGGAGDRGSWRQGELQTG
jgi:hypothetical protein